MFKVLPKLEQSTEFQDLVDFVFTSSGGSALAFMMVLFVLFCFIGETVGGMDLLAFCIHKSICSFVRSLVCLKQCNTRRIKPDSYAVNVLKIFHLYAHYVSHAMHWLFSAWGAMDWHRMA